MPNKLAPSVYVCETERAAVGGQTVQIFYMHASMNKDNPQQRDLTGHLEVVFVTTWKCSWVFLGSGGESEHCELNLNTPQLNLLHLIFITFSLLISKCKCTVSNIFSLFFIKSSWSVATLTRCVVVVVLRRRWRLSLLFASGELADFAGCGDSFTRGVGRGGGPAFSFGFAV